MRHPNFREEKNNEKYPQYCFDKPKGYGTRKRLKMLKKYSPLLSTERVLNQ